MWLLLQSDLDIYSMGGVRRERERGRD